MMIMDRRKFILSSVVAGLSAGTATLAQDVFAGVTVPGEVKADGRKGNVSCGVEDHLKVEGYVREPSHRIPVVACADVVVAGGGAAGVAAAVNAARQGSSVILIEKANFLGGLWTGGLVLPVLARYGLGKSVPWDLATGGFCEEMCRELLDNGWAVDPLNPKVDPEAAKYVLEKALDEAGVKVLYNATVSGVTMSGSRIEAVLTDCNTGRIAIRCKAAVDASGDGVLFNMAGDPHEARRYHISSSYRVGGSSSPKAGWSTPIESMKYRTWGTRQPEDGLDVFRVSQLQHEHRLEVWNHVRSLRGDPGCEDAFLMEMAPMTGVRVTRVLDSLHNVTLDESMSWTAFEDVIGMAGACDPFDYKGKRISPRQRPVWQIPYRSLLPRETANLLVCGRCFGYDQGITWDAREISTCFTTGQAAGIAAAVSVSRHCCASEVPIPTLQQELRKEGVRLDF